MPLIRQLIHSVVVYYEYHIKIYWIFDAKKGLFI